MVATEVPDSSTRDARSGWVALSGLVVAAALFLASSVLQLTASLQRWVVFRGSRSPNDISAEDHLFDYSFPSDPWTPIANAAELFGVGTLLAALGILILPIGVSPLSRVPRYRAIVVAGEIVLAVAVAGSIALDGTHALLSGTNGVPSPLQHTGAVGWVAVVGLVALTILWRHKPRAVVLACACLVANTWLGYLLAAFVIAPMISGGSHDTAPWTESVVAVATAAAAASLLWLVAVSIRRRPSPAH